MGPSDLDRSPITEVARLLADSGHAVLLSGSGISAESGVPTFRDAQTGLWARYRPEELATPEAFFRDPGMVWRWYEYRRELIRATSPNPAHFAVTDLSRRIQKLTVITQNVDGLHQRAGLSNVIEFHGNITKDICSVELVETSAAESEDGPPVCQACGALMRPAVVWFGEAIPEPELAAATSAISDCTVFLSVGTSSLVYPAAAMADVAQAAGATIIEINPDETPLSVRADHCLRGAAGQLLPAIVQAIDTLRKNGI